MSKIHVGMIGLGTVGTGVARLLKSKQKIFKEKTGFQFVLKTVCVRSLAKRRSVSLKGVKLTKNPDDILQDREIDQVVELMGGISKAKHIIEHALQKQKDVISANKHLFAERGHELYRLSSRTGSHIGIEAAVCGGLPIVKAIREGLAVNQISQIHGIMNGTCNYILSAMTLKNQSYEHALKVAQARGLAERNPAMDVGGMDSAHKLAILARYAFHREIAFNKIHVEGIRHISPIDIAVAKSLGYRIKLVAIAKKDAKGLELRVHPTLLDKGHLLANVNGVNNGVVVKGSEVGESFFFGKGAGQKPTASAVISDMMDIAKKSTSGAPSDEQLFSQARIKPLKDCVSRFYLRIQVSNRTGAMAKLTQILGAKGISISSVHQDEIKGVKSVPVIILTHLAAESRLKAAVNLMNRSRYMTRKVQVIRVEGYGS